MHSYYGKRNTKAAFEQYLYFAANKPNNNRGTVLGRPQLSFINHPAQRCQFVLHTSISTTGSSNTSSSPITTGAESKKTH